MSITTGNGAAAVAAPAAPLSLNAAPDENRVPLRWTESFGATSYKVKRATTSGGPYTTIAAVTAPSHLDGTVSNGTYYYYYYYVVSAVNAAGEGANSAQDSATPVSPMVNVAFGGTANDSLNNPNGGEGAAKAFDRNAGTKWLCSAQSWLQYDFGAGATHTIKRYSITSANDLPGRDPEAWQFQGSNDGSNWTMVDTRSSQTFPYRYHTLTYDVVTPGAYRYYRLNVTANNGATSTQLAELALLTDTGRTVPDGLCRIFSRKSRKAIGTNNGAITNGTPLVQWG